MSNNTLEMLSKKKIFDLMDERFKENNILYKHNIESFNSCVIKLINYLENNKNVFSENKNGNLIERNYFSIKNIRIRPAMKKNGKDLLMPTEAKIRNITYIITFIADVTQYKETYSLSTDKIISNEAVGETSKDVTVMEIPNMVNSNTCSNKIQKDENECIIDPGGYFIVNGGEKLMLSIEKQVDNKPLVFMSKDGTGVNAVNIYRVQIHSSPNDLNSMMQKTQIILKKDYSMVVKVPLFHEVSIFIILKALGLVKDKEVVDYITYNSNDNEMIKLLEIIINISKTEGETLILSQDDALNYLIQKVKVSIKYNDLIKENKENEYLVKKEHLKMLLIKSFIPHINNFEYNDIQKAKGIYVCYMINKLLNCYLGRTELDDRDSFINKRITMPGDTILDIAIKNHKKMLNNTNKSYKKRMQTSNENVNVINTIETKPVLSSLKKALSNGVNDDINQKNLAMVLPRLSLIQTLVYLRCIKSATSDGSMQTLVQPRMFHPSQTGFISTTETPEHAKIGYTKHLSLTSSITVEDKNQTILLYKEIINNELFIHFDYISSFDLLISCKIFLNGNWIGFTKKPTEFYNEIKLLKQNNIIDQTNGISYDIKNNEIKFYSDTGRLYRPLLNVKDNKLILNDKMIDDILNSKVQKNTNKWNLLLSKYPEAISIVDVEEQIFTLIASNENKLIEMKNREKNVYKDSNEPVLNNYDDSCILNYTYCEINPVFTMGIISSRTIFANHNMCTRNLMYYAQAKQAMGIYASNWKNRLDISYILYYTQNPLVYTKIDKYVKTDILPAGENIILLIDCYTGSNQDDSLVFNETSLNRGLFRADVLKKFYKSIKKDLTTAENNYFGIPDKSKLLNTVRYNSYDKLTPKGFPKEETVIYKNEAIIGQVTPIKNQDEENNKTLKDNSEIYKGNSPMIIDKVYHGIKNDEDYNMIAIRGRIEKTPKIGDKFCLDIEKTDVLTINGWVKLKDLTMNDYIASLDNGKIIYEKPKGIYIIPYNGKMHKIKNDYVDLEITLDHKLYIRKENKDNYELVDSSKAFGSKYNMRKDALFDYDEVKIITRNKVDINYNNYLKLLALYINYGNVGDKGIINFNFNDDKIIEYFKEVLKLLKLTIKNYNKSKFRNSENFKIYNETLYELFNEITDNMGNKLIPKDVIKLNSIQSKIFIENLFYNTNKIFTQSQELINDITMICIHSGLVSDTYYDIRNNTNIIQLLSDENNEVYINPNDESMYDFNGLVGCLEISSHVFMVKQNNKYVWTGNCCYSSDHEVMTFDGWKNITEITMQDKIACLENDNEIIYREPKEVMSYEYDSEIHGKMYEVNTNKVSLRVTPNHRMYVGDRQGNNYKMELAEDIYGKRRKYKNNADKYILNQQNSMFKYNDNNEPIEFIFNYKNEQKTVDLNAWCIVFGIWIAEGTVYKDKKYESYTTTFATDKPRVKEILHPLLNKMDFKYNNKTERQKAYDDNLWSMHDKFLGNYLKSNDMKNALHKFLPDWTKYLTMKQCKLLIHGMMLGDGHIIATDKNAKYNSSGVIYNNNNNPIDYNDNIRKNETRRYDTSSFQLVKDFQQLCLHAGYGSTYMTRNKEGHSHIIKTGRGKGKTITSNELSYRVTIVETQNNPIVNKNMKKDGTNRQDELIDFKGNVYCCKMYDDDSKNDGIILIQRRSKMVWCGNSRSGQKGTIGLVLHASKMPFTEDGIIPDVIMNPHAYPTRRSFAQLLENALGKIGAIKGIKIDGTPFNNIDFEKDIMEVLEELGYNGDSTETFYDGFSGRKIVKPLTVGINYYLRLKHLVDEKVYSRSNGASKPETRQPLEGRSKGGGGRLGEMERDALIAHGNSYFLKERLVDMSDIYTTHVCDICGLFAQRTNKKNNKFHPTKNDSFECNICRNKNKISQIKIPYSAKLLFQELTSMNIAPRIITDNHVDLTKYE